jgi:hypothetical protein
LGDKGLALYLQSLFLPVVLQGAGMGFSAASIGGLRCFKFDDHERMM